jgi:hypothetical protein
MTAKDMLAVVLRRAELNQRERESFTDMWDRIHRFNRCSDKQKAWIEKVYFGQKLDAEPTSRRRVVVPTWQKGEPGAPPMQPTQRALSTPSPVSTTASVVVETGLVKTNAKQIMLRRKSGTFLLPPPSVRGGATPAEMSPREAKRIGYINYPGVQRETLVTSLGAFEDVCPHIAPGSKQHRKIAGFFEMGGVVLKVKPLPEVRAAYSMGAA